MVSKGVIMEKRVRSAYFSTKTYVVGTQKYHLNKMVLHILKIMDKKI